MRHSLLPFLLLLAAAGLSHKIASAQTYEEILAAYPEAREMTVAFDGVLAFERPHPDTRVTTRFNKGEIVLAYEKLGPYYKVALPEMGHVGYVRVVELAEYEWAPVDAYPAAERTPEVNPPPGSGGAPRVGYKDPGVATLVAVLITGGGHLYAGEIGKGLGLLLLSGFSAGMGYGYYTSSSSESASQVLALGLLGAFVVWVYGVADASSAAHRMNAHNGFVDVPLQLSPQFLTDQQALRPGLSLSIRM